MRTLLLAALAGTALTAVPAGAATPALAGTTVVTATRPVVTTVRLAHDATVATPFGESPDLSVSAPGALAMFALVGTGRVASTVLVGGQARSQVFVMPLPPSYTQVGGTLFSNVKTFGDTTTLPAGTYQLYVLPGSAPARFTLRLHGVGGRSAIAPATPVAGAVVAGSPGTTGVRYGPSVTHRLDGRGLALTVLRADVMASAVWAIETCHHVVSDSEAVVSCANADKHVVTDHRAPETEPRSLRFLMGLAGLPAAQHDVRASFTAAGALTAGDYVTGWLTYR